MRHWMRTTEESTEHCNQGPLEVKGKEWHTRANSDLYIPSLPASHLRNGKSDLTVSVPFLHSFRSDSTTSSQLNKICNAIMGWVQVSANRPDPPLSVEPLPFGLFHSFFLCLLLLPLGHFFYLRLSRCWSRSHRVSKNLLLNILTKA